MPYVLYLSAAGAHAQSHRMQVLSHNLANVDTPGFKPQQTILQARFAEMIEQGANPYHVAQYVYGTYSLGRIKLLNLALDSIEISKNGKLSLMTLTREMFDETRTHPEDADGLINYARNIEAVQVAVLIQESKKNSNQSGTDVFHVSLRSDGEVDVAAIASSFGGGGHASAAGFTIQSELADLKSKIFDLAEAL